MKKTPTGSGQGKSSSEVTFGQTKFEENQRREWLKKTKPLVYEKVLRFNDKLARGEGIPIIQFQYDYTCNFRCEHCSIEKFQMSRKQEAESHRRHFTIDDVKELSRQAHEMGLTTIVITGGEPLIFKDFDDLVRAIDPAKFWIVSDTNGWHLDEEKARHLKDIGVDKIQLSLDGCDAQTHDSFRRRSGSWERCLKAVEACRKVGLHVILSTVVWRGRVRSQEFTDYLEMAKQLGVGTYVSYAKPVGAYEGRYDQMLTEDEEDSLRELEKKYDVFTHMTPSYGMDIGCIAVKRILPVTRYGDVLPCPYIPVSLGNFFEEPLKDIVARGLNLHWFNPRVKMPCLCGVDRTFIEKVIIPTYGDVQVPVPYTKIFSDDDYVDPGKEKTSPQYRENAACAGEQDRDEAENAAVETIETKDGIIPITWAPPPDTHYHHRLTGDPEHVKDRKKR